MKLKAVREELIQKQHAPTNINDQIGRIKRVFKWAVSEEMVPPSVFHGLQAVVGLQRGRCDAVEPDPILAVEQTHIDAVLPLLRPPVRTMVELQRLTGLRPGEVCGMQPG